ncbi:hypothetical protein GCM10008085_11420 [Winogradskyella epiphytica]|nr:hypothetical protein GCM10008085_11420 [Winogradskyella epiphytica]
MTPFSSNPTANIIKARIVMVAGLAKPLIASSGDVNCNKTRATIMKKAILSIGNNSVINRTILIPIIIKTKRIESSIFAIVLG